MTVTVTSRRLPGPAAPGFFLTIACRSHKVFVTYRLKITPYLAHNRQVGDQRECGAGGPRQAWGRRAWLEGGAWSDSARQWAGPGCDYPGREPGGRRGAARAARRLPARRPGRVQQRAPPDRRGAGRVRTVRGAGGGERGRPGRPGRPVPVGHLAAVARTTRRQLLTHDAARRGAGRAACRGRRRGGRRERVRAGLPLGGPPRGGGAPGVLRGPAVRPRRRGRSAGQGGAAGTAPGRPAPGDGGGLGRRRRRRRPEPGRPSRRRRGCGGRGTVLL